MNAHNLRWIRSGLLASLCVGLISCQTINLKSAATPAPRPAPTSAPAFKPPPKHPAPPQATASATPVELPPPETTPESVDSVVNGNVWDLTMENRRISVDRSAVGTPVVVSQSPQNELMLSVSTDWAFAPQSAKMAEGLLPVLDALAASLSLKADVQLSIMAHTDDVGSAAQNNSLSLERARGVRDYLIGRQVITPFIQAVGRGARDPLAPNDTAEGRTRNRRLEILVRQTVN